MGLRALWLSLWGWIFLSAGCSALPDMVHEPQFHNPFPQLHRVAVLPFYNQSASPTVDQDRVAMLYYNELQAIPGFEVMPVGVARRILEGAQIEPATGEDFQRVAQLLGVDAVVVGSVTEYSPYYPPRLGLTTRWYAANPCFHPIPPGYGLPWGTAGEEEIPSELLFEAEFALAQAQLETQTPGNPDDRSAAANDGVQPAAAQSELPVPEAPPDVVGEDSIGTSHGVMVKGRALPQLPPGWPDPRGLVPPSPSPLKPLCIPQSEPVMSWTQLYHGNDSELTRKLAEYFYFRDEARFGGWQAYLQRSEDFIRFCCHLHITEMLASRGGAGETRVVWRWPIGRYQR